MSFRGQPSWAKMASPGGRLTALVCRLTKKVTKAEELTYLSTNIDLTVIKTTAFSSENLMLRHKYVRKYRKRIVILSESHLVSLLIVKSGSYLQNILRSSYGHSMNIPAINNITALIKKALYFICNKKHHNI
jgi:hypothetical protein